MKAKKFDCVQMKHEIQERLQKEFSGLSSAEIRRLTVERINADPVLGPIWRTARRVRKPEPERVPEDRAPIKT